MNAAVIVHIILYILTVVLGGLAIWYKSNAKLNQMVSALIAESENRYRDFTKAGGMKFEWVVTQLYAMIPAPVRPFVSEAMIRTLVQLTFDAVSSYAKSQLDQLVNKHEQTADMEE